MTVAEQVANAINPPTPPSTVPPRQTWAEFVAAMPRGKAPQQGDIFRRWDEMEEVSSASNSPGAKPSLRSKENGEQRAYLAWIAGTMEPEERAYLSMLTLRTDQIVLLAIIPAVRELHARLDRQAALLKDAHNEIASLKGRLTEVEVRTVPVQKTGGGK